MSSSNRFDRGHSRPSVSRASVHSSSNATQETKMIEPTRDSQRFYNQIRQDMDKQRLEMHVSEGNNLSLPRGEPMSRSTTGDSLYSPSTTYSQAGDSNLPLSPDPATGAAETADQKPHRGRRKGPLDIETRIQTAFKRKFKLTCEFHRAKRTCCKCYDFSKLEEGYSMFLRSENQKSRSSQSRGVRSYGDLGTFGTGGVASSDATPANVIQYPNVDFTELQTTSHEPSYRHADLTRMLTLDISSAASVNAVVTAPRQETSFFAHAMSLSPALSPAPRIAQTTTAAVVADDDPFPIGCSMPYYNRWECKYQGATTTGDCGSLISTTTDTCPWTGSFGELYKHFRDAHHPFDFAEESQVSICQDCAARCPGWDVERTCIDPNRCAPDAWQKWVMGTTTRQQQQSNPNLTRVTVSEASGSRWGGSWQDPTWNNLTASSSNITDPWSFSTNNNYTYDKSGYYERSGNWDAKHAACGDEKVEGDDTDCRPCEGLQDYYQPDALSAIRDFWFSNQLLQLSPSPSSGCCCTTGFRSLPLLYRRYLVFSVLALLAVFREECLAELGDAIRTLFITRGYRSWSYYLALAIFGSVGVVWIATMGCLRLLLSWRTDDEEVEEEQQLELSQTQKQNVGRHWQDGGLRALVPAV